MPENLKNKEFIVCRGCTCLCDDIPAFEAKDLGKDLGRADSTLCEKGRFFLGQAEVESGCVVEAQPNSLERTVIKAAEAIKRSSAPLVCGLEGLSTQAQKSAWRLTDLMRGTIDIGLSNVGRGKMLALQRVGSVTGTLGEVANRADLVLFWNCNPIVTHPRLLQRYARPISRNSRSLILISDRPNETSQLVDFFLPVEKSNQAAAITVLRHGLRLLEDRTIKNDSPQLGESDIRDLGITEEQVLQMTGHSISVWLDLIARLVSSKYGAWLSGPTDHSAETDLESEALAQLIRDLNDHTRFIQLALRQDSNAQSAENVLAWSSGFPFAINCNFGYPRFNGMEYSAVNLLERGECDLLLLGSTELLDQQLADLSDRAIRQFHAVPKIVLRETASQNEIKLDNVVAEFRVAKVGWSDGGDFCRMDGVSLKVEALKQNSCLITAQSVFERLFAAISATDR